MTSSHYFGVSYTEKYKTWAAARWSKKEKKLISKGYFKDEKTAALASDNLARKLIQISKRKISIKNDESRLRPYDVDRLHCDNKKAQKMLKWKPKVSINEGLKKTYDWAIKNKVEFSAPFKRWYYKKT